MRYFISLLGLAMIVGAGYFALAQYTNVAYGQSSLLVAGQTSASTNANGAQVLSWLSRLQSIKLDGKIFSNSNFTSLQDRSVDIAPQAVGRPNPYLPTFGTAASSTSTPKVSLPRAQ